MQKHGKTFDDKVLFWENTGKHKKIPRKTRETPVKHGKTQKNMQVLFWENTGKHLENMGKHTKTWESIG